MLMLMLILILMSIGELGYISVHACIFNYDLEYSALQALTI